MAAEKTVEGDAIQFGGDIILINFKLEPVQLIAAKKIIGSYIKKIREAANYKGLKIRLRKHEHGKAVLYEIEAEALITEGKKTNEKSAEGRNIVLNSSVTDYNLNLALTYALKKIFFEALHKSRTTKEIGEEMKNYKSKKIK